MPIGALPSWAADALTSGEPSVPSDEMPIEGEEPPTWWPENQLRCIALSRERVKRALRSEPELAWRVLEVLAGRIAAGRPRTSASEPGVDQRALRSDTEGVTVTEPIRHSSTRARVVAVNDGVRSERTDSLATEEPLEIRVQGAGQEQVQVAVTMRTPGGDFELAAGFLFTEGLIAPGDAQRVAYCDNLPGEDQRYNVVSVTLARPFDAERLRRNFYANSSCGVCGKAALEDIEVRCEPVAPGPEVDLGVVVSLPERLRAAQSVFERTGGLHAAGLFAPDGEALTVREDVGRHNAVDKVVGERYLAGGVPADGTILQVSGRASFEIVQKAAVAGIPIVSAVSAPSSLAVEAAERFGMTLLGFVRDGRANVYAHPERVRG